MRTRLALALLLVAAPSAALAQEARFTQEAVARGCSFSVANNRTFGTGVAFADLDNDHDPDLIVLGRLTPPPGGTFTVGIFENRDGSFVNRSEGNGIPARTGAAGVCLADYDADGDLDIFLSCWLEADCLLRNDGNFRFTDVTAAMGLGSIGAGQGACWGDYNNDGWLDLYVANRTGTNFPDPPFPESTVPNLLYRNNAGQGFTEVAQQLGVDAGLDPSFQAAFFDFDQDGDADLYLSNDKGFSRGCAVRNRMWRNDNGAFTDISESSGANGCIDAMCVAVGDWNADLHQDLYITNVEVGNYLYINQRDGTFLNRAADFGLLSQRVDWGAVFVDYNNDTRPDLYVCQNAAANRLFRHNPDDSATDVAPTLGITDSGATFCCAAADIDADGDLDLAAVNVPNPPITFTGQLRLYINHEGERRSWTSLRVVGRYPNLFAVGAQVQIRTGKTQQMQEVIAGSNFKAQNDLALHFGLDAADTIDEITVRWPGADRTPRVLTNYPARHPWTLFPPERLGDANNSGHVDSADFFAFLDCFFTSPGPLQPGCEIFDMNSDAQLTSSDFFDLLTRLFQ